MGPIHSSLFKEKETDCQKLSLVWLDHSIEQSNDYQKKLSSSINRFQFFTDPHKCKKYLKSSGKDGQIILLLNNQLAEKLIERIDHLPQVISIYIHVTNGSDNDQWMNKSPKIRCVSRDLHILLEKIQSDCWRRKRQMTESLSIGGFKKEKSTSELNGKFVHSELSIDVLLRMKSNENDKKEFIKYCKEEYQDELDVIKEFERDYRSDCALWWYTRESFLYRLLNKALRIQNLDMLFQLRFVIRDIEKELIKHKCLSSVRLYRGQFISKEELQFLQNSVGKSLSMNSFVSTSVNEEQAREFLDDLSISSHLERVLFQIDANPTIQGIKPFADITPYSYFPDEQEFLIMLGAIFTVKNISRKKQIWFIEVQLTSNNNDNSQSMLEHMKKNFRGEENQADLLSFGTVLANMGNYQQAETYFHRLLNELPSDHPDIAHCYHNLGQIALEKDQYQLSLDYFQKSLQIKLRRNQADHSTNLAETYNSIGILHRKKGDLDEALRSYHKALNIFQDRSNRNDQIEIAKSLNNIANIYQLKKSYSDALHYYRQALQIQETYLPKDHSDLGLLYANIAGLYQCLGDHHRALEQYKVALTILAKSLPPEHPAIAMTFKNLAVVYEDIGDLHQALFYLNKSLTIRREILPSGHPQLQTIVQDIQRISVQLQSFS